MLYPLVQVSDTKYETSWHLVIEDYTKEHALCRSGIWVGLVNEFREVVILSYEHGDDSIAVGWAINGTTVIDPGYSGAIPGGFPCPGAPTVWYTCPVDGYFHRIRLESTPGDPPECVSLQVLYRTYPYVDPAQDGPSRVVCLAGSETIWPADLVKAADACYAALWEKVHGVVEGPVFVPPGGPVEWLARLPAEEATRLEAEVATLTQLDTQAQPRLAKAIQDDLMGILRGHWFGVGGVGGSPSVQGPTGTDTRDSG